MIEVDGTKNHKLVNTKEVQEKVIEKDLNFKLTEEDFADKGKEAGKIAGELNKLNIEFDKVKKEWKDKLNRKESELSIILGTIRRGDEDRRVKCVERKDFNNHVVEYIFNGDVMHSREMKMDERQMELVKGGKEVSKDNEKAAMQEQLSDDQKDVRDVINMETNKKTAQDLSNNTH